MLFAWIFLSLCSNLSPPEYYVLLLNVQMLDWTNDESVWNNCCWINWKHIYRRGLIGSIHLQNHSFLSRLLLIISLVSSMSCGLPEYTCFIFLAHLPALELPATSHKVSVWPWPWPWSWPRPWPRPWPWPWPWSWPWPWPWPDHNHDHDPDHDYCPNHDCWRKLNVTIDQCYWPWPWLQVMVHGNN